MSFPYGERSALRAVDLQVVAGTTTAVVGASGSGTSTLVRLLHRAADPQQGQVLLGGVDVREAHPAELAARVAVVPQEVWLLEGSIADNIALVRPGATRAQVEAAGRAANLGDFVATLSRGWDTPVGEAGVAVRR